MNDHFGPWNPGIDSHLPRDLLPLVTMFRPEHVFESLRDIEELKGFSGLPFEELATFRPKRLMVHELLIRISADYSVSDGNDYEDLGINFRSIAQRLLDGSLLPRLSEVETLYAACGSEVSAQVDTELDRVLNVSVSQHNSPGHRPWWRTLFAGKAAPSPPSPSPQLTVAAATKEWGDRATDPSRSRLERAVVSALARVIGAVVIKHGQLRGDRELLARIVTHCAMNSYAAQRIGDLIQPWIEQGATDNGFRKLPLQPSPVIMNVKGASAAGKSTLRPLQQQLTRRIGLDWADFALISPDIFRKFLLDYESLGDAYKYAGTLSGEELQIVDQKLDRYVASRAASGHIPHLLIDRFRFDSFTLKSPEEGSNLLTRFGSKVFMFFVVTPPHQTVERAWHRGLQVGRFKAVDDLIDHNIEAFNGMPALFFTWALNRSKDVHYEFLDNSVAKGAQPKTIAFGENGSLNILDLEKLMDIDRYQQLNVKAANPDDVYPQKSSQLSVHHLQFVDDCLKKLDRVEYTDVDRGTLLLRVVNGHCDLIDEQSLRTSIGNSEIADGVLTLIRKLPVNEPAEDCNQHQGPLDCENKTLGWWEQRLSG